VQSFINSRTRVGSRPFHLATLGLLICLLAACGSSNSGNGASATGGKCSGLDTITPGTLKVAIQSFMPIVGEVNGQATGLDGDNLTYIAGQLGCKLELQISDSAGNLAAVQSHRVDATVGAWAWTTARAKAGRFTDPLYYQPVVLAERKGTNITRVSQFSGKNLCTLTGFAFIPAMQQIKDANVRTYPTIATQLLDIQAGRCDVGFGNPLVQPYAIANNPALKDLAVEYLQPSDAAEVAAAPLFASVIDGYQDAFYLNGESAKLEEAMNPIIDGMITSGKEASLLKQWGITDTKFWLVPRASLADQRKGVDRPSDWRATACAGSSCG